MSTEINWHGRMPIPLRSGIHEGISLQACLREMVHYLATGIVRDRTPSCACPVLCSVAPALTDSSLWLHNAERENTLLPYASRLLDTRSDSNHEAARAFALVDEALCIVSELPDAFYDNWSASDILRGCPAITSEISASIAHRRLARFINCETRRVPIYRNLPLLLQALAMCINTPDEWAEAAARLAASTVVSVACIAPRTDPNVPRSDLKIASVSKRLLDRGLAVEHPIP